MIRATFGSFGIPVISPDMLSTNITWHHNSGLIGGYMKLSDENVNNLVTMISCAQRLANALRKPDHLGFPTKQCYAPGFHPCMHQCPDGGWEQCSTSLDRWQAFSALAGEDTRLFPRTGYSTEAYAFVTHNPLITTDTDVSGMVWRKRTDPIWATEFLLATF